MFILRHTYIGLCLYNTTTSMPMTSATDNSWHGVKASIKVRQVLQTYRQESRQLLLQGVQSGSWNMYTPYMIQYGIQ